MQPIFFSMVLLYIISDTYTNTTFSGISFLFGAQDLICIVLILDAEERICGWNVKKQIVRLP